MKMIKCKGRTEEGVGDKVVLEAWNKKTSKQIKKIPQKKIKNLWWKSRSCGIIGMLWELRQC
jgi:hypothetical protein